MHGLHRHHFLRMHISPSLSFIIDPSDSTYKLQGVFTEGELREIKDYNAIVMDTLPKDVVDYLRSFECVSGVQSRLDMVLQQLPFSDFIYRGSTQVRNCAKHVWKIWNGTILLIRKSISITIG
jgi:hypothetical protein